MKIDKKRKAEMKVRERRGERRQLVGSLGPQGNTLNPHRGTRDKKGRNKWPNEEAAKVPVPP